MNGSGSRQDVSKERAAARMCQGGRGRWSDRLGAALSYFGQRGWELVTVYDKASNWLQGMEKGFILFKRPVAPGEEPQGNWTEFWTADQVLSAYRQSTA